LRRQKMATMQIKKVLNSTEQRSRAFRANQVPSLNLKSINSDQSHDKNSHRAREISELSQRETHITKTLSSARKESGRKQAESCVEGKQLFKAQEEAKFPMTPAKALKLYGKQLSEFERQEILDYPHIYYLGIGT